MRKFASCSWPLERKRSAAIDGPLDTWLTRPDTRVIRREGWLSLLTPSAPGTSLNEVVYSQLRADDAERTIEAVIASYGALGKPVKWCVGPWTRPDDFGERLARRGFRAWDVRGMGIETRTRLEAAGDLDVREVDETSVSEYVDASMRGWNTPPSERPAELTTHRAALAESPRRVHLFLARAGGELVGTAGLVLRGAYGYLTAAQVLGEARGRGAYRALVASRLSFLAARGIEYAVTHAREATSAPILEHLGFETLFRSQCWLLEAQSQV